MLMATVIMTATISSINLHCRAAPSASIPVDAIHSASAASVTLISVLLSIVRRNTCRSLMALQFLFGKTGKVVAQEVDY